MELWLQSFEVHPRDRKRKPLNIVQICDISLALKKKTTIFLFGCVESPLVKVGG